MMNFLPLPFCGVRAGVASGNLGSLAFAQEPFTLAFEGLAENLTSGTVPYVVNGNPRWDWFSQDFLNRIIFNLPSAQIFTGVLNPAAYQLLGVNYGPFIQEIPGGQSFAPFTTLSLCGSGLNQYACWDDSTLGFNAVQPLDFRQESGRVPLQGGVLNSVQFLTSRGELNLAGIDGATFQIMTPVPEPEMSVLMLAGMGGLVSVMHRRRRESQAWISDERDV